MKTQSLKAYNIGKHEEKACDELNPFNRNLKYIPVFYKSV